MRPATALFIAAAAAILADSVCVAVDGVNAGSADERRERADERRERADERRERADERRERADAIVAAVATAQARGNAPGPPLPRGSFRPATRYAFCLATDAPFHPT